MSFDMEMAARKWSAGVTLSACCRTRLDGAWYLTDETPWQKKIVTDACFHANGPKKRPKTNIESV